jgi:hypothetical protein
MSAASDLAWLRRPVAGAGGTLAAALTQLLTAWRSWGRWGRWWRALPAALLLLLWAGALAQAEPKVAAWLGLGWCLWMLLLLSSLCMGLMRLNHPDLARLVPQQLRGLRLATAALMVAFVATATAVSGLMAYAFAAGGTGAGLGLVPSELAGSVALRTVYPCLLILIALVGSVRTPWVFTACLVALVFLPGWTRQYPQSFPVQALHGLEQAGTALNGHLLAAPWPLALWGAALLTLSVACPAAWLLMEGGGPAHRTRWLKMETAMHELRARRLGHSAQAQLSATWAQALWGRLRAWPYRLSLQAGLHRAGAAQRALLMLGPGLTPGWGLLGVWALSALVWVALYVQPNGVGPVADGAKQGVPMGAMVALFWPIWVMSVLIAMALLLSHMKAALTRSTAEQALLALTPQVPQGPALNRALSWRLWGHYGLAWAGGLAPMLLGPWLWGWPAQWSWGLAAAAALAFPVVSLSPCWARLPLLNRRWHQVLGEQVFVWLSLALPAALWWVCAVQPMPQALGLGLSLALGVWGWMAWRWRGMGREPGAFPVGRLEPRSARPTAATR